MKNCKHLLYALSGCLTLAAFLMNGYACSNESKSRLEDTVDSFATAYFNWRFPDAVKYCTPQSLRWLTYASSQVTRKDVEVLRNKQEGAQCQIDDIELPDDSTANILLTVNNFLSMDTIGDTPSPTAEKSFHIRAIQRQGRWMIDLDALPN